MELFIFFVILVVACAIPGTIIGLIIGDVFNGLTSRGGDTYETNYFEDKRSIHYGDSTDLPSVK